MLLSVTSMRLDEINFELPDSYIAQTPSIPRDSCKLMLIERSTGQISHHIFRDLPDILPQESLIVRNSSKVIPARLQGQFPTGGKWELFFLKELENNLAECFIRPGKKFPEGKKHILITEQGTEFEVTVQQQKEDTRILHFAQTGTQTVKEFFKQEAEIPLPPYIDSDPAQYSDNYQTIYAKEEGSVAAPTAGLHFTEELDQRLLQHNHTFAEVTLHVGAGTFQPIKVEDTSLHTMHSEDFFITEKNLQCMRDAKAAKKPILTVGTTSSRVVEHIWNTGLIEETHDIMGETSIYIHPPYSFKGVDMMITNFHLPKSTLLLMVASFIGDLDFTLKAYEEAKKHDYRFYSFGDAMLII